MKKLCVFLVFLMFVGISILHAQTVRVTGTVTSSEDGLPLPGVSVVAKGTTIGISTDANGKYSFDVPTSAISLEFSFVGYKTKLVNIDGQVTINATLEPEAIELSEVVVTGLGMPTDKRKVAISIETVTDKALTKVPTASLDAALIGRIAGASIQSTSGQPGQQANIILRGINTLTSTQPMILVDGIEISTTESFNGSGNFSSRFADLDLSNVERVEVVQGAAAATIYGAQGANGVIQIFTKKGKKGEKTNISFNSSVAINNALKGDFGVAKHHYYQTDTEGYILASGTTNRIAPDPETGYWTLPDETFDETTMNNRPFKERTFDHLDQYFKKNTVTYNTNLTISGAGDKSDYSLTFSNMNQHSPVRGYYNKNNISANIGTELFKNLTLRSSTQLIISQNTTGGINNSNDVNSGMGNVINLPSFVNLKFKDSAGNYPVNYDPNDNGILPFYSYANREYFSKVNRVIQGINVNYKLNKFIELDWKFGYDQYRYDFSDFIKNQTYTNTPNVGIDPISGSLFKRNAWERFMNSIASAFIRFDLEKDFGLRVPIQSTTQVAYDWRQNDYERVDAQGTGFALSPPYTLSTASEYTASDFITKFVTFGYLVNQKFDYGTLGGFSIGFRSDYSSEFGKGSKPFTFPRADAYFRISDILKVDRIYELKLRTAYGQAGVQPDRYSRLVTLNSSPISGESALYLPAIARNPELDVELSKELEIGLDFGVNVLSGSFLSKISGSASYWTRTSEGSIWDIDVAPSTGAT
ncbi:MAG: carboxypeptidase-like regulatory domain-containing protein, partial [Bacteroidales bacterium]